MTLDKVFPRRRDDVLARKIREGDWEYAALLVLLRIVNATHAMPPGDIDDVLALIAAGAEKEARHG